MDSGEWKMARQLPITRFQLSVDEKKGKQGPFPDIRLPSKFAYFLRIVR
jgi:hypothetical protein